MTYAEQLKSPKWQKKRLEILERDGFICTNCGEDDKQLHVHHRYYGKNKKVWEYDDDTLTTLCEECHKYEHDMNINEELLKSTSKAIHNGFDTSFIFKFLDAYSEGKIIDSQIWDIEKKLGIY